MRRVSLELVLVAAILTLAACGGDKPAAPMPESAPTAPADGGAAPGPAAPGEPGEAPSGEPSEQPPNESRIPRQVQFTLSVGDTALVLGGDVSCRVWEEGVHCSEAGPEGPVTERYVVTLTGEQILVRYVDASGEIQPVFAAGHAEPSAAAPAEAVGDAQFVILEPEDAAAIAGTDIVCIAGIDGFVGCSLLGEGLAAPSPGNYAVGLDAAGASVARVTEDGDFEEVFAETYEAAPPEGSQPGE